MSFLEQLLAKSEDSTLLDDIFSKLGGTPFDPSAAANMVRALYDKEVMNNNDVAKSQILSEGRIIEAKFDEYLLQRIFWHPGVRGIRVYLALSDKKYNTETKKCEDAGKSRLSFVLVGIDKDGNDVVNSNCECGGDDPTNPPTDQGGTKDGKITLNHPALMISGGQKLDAGAGTGTELKLLQY
jgi:hypothetical protein